VREKHLGELGNRRLGGGRVGGGRRRAHQGDQCAVEPLDQLRDHLVLLAEPVEHRRQRAVAAAQIGEHALILDGMVHGQDPAVRRAERADRPVVLPHGQAVDERAGDGGVLDAGADRGDGLPHPFELGPKVIVDLDQDLGSRHRGICIALGGVPFPADARTRIGSKAAATRPVSGGVSCYGYPLRGPRGGIVMGPGVRYAVTAATLAAVVAGGGVAGASTAKKKHLPAHFPKPPHSKITSETKIGPEAAYTMKVKSEPQAFKFWKSKLPAHGWTISKATSKHGAGAIIFSGHGYSKHTALAVVGKTATVSFYKS
jgi:hypothetical protein